MEWLSALNRTIDYLEKNLLSESTADVASHAGISSVYLNKGFEIITGMSISQYVKNRRLYLAAVEILKGAKVIDTAVKYCYTTPESFSKAFYRFHGLTPLNLKKHPERIKVFQPISFSISISGGEKLKVRFENLKYTKLIGFTKTFTFDEAYKQIPVFWKEKLNSILSKYWKMNQSVISSNQITDLQKAVIENNIGCFGASFDCEGEHFKYGILGVLKNSDIEASQLGLEVLEIPDGLYAKFESVGP
ncbi:AraC family transcriptional regulator, partial [Methanobrevibacter sp.]